MKFTKNLCGSKLEILILSEWEFSDLVQKCFEYWENFEDKYSRFNKNNFLSQLNEKKYSEITPEFYQIISLWLKLSDFSDWYFDISILPFLENKWYWISKEKIPENIWYKNIVLKKYSITLNNNISIDIWALWKWFIVDKIYNILDNKVDSFIINFWWDIRVKWKKEILLEDPLNEWKYIWKTIITHGSIASSNGSKRRFWNSHHLINPKTWESQNEIAWVFVSHKNCSFADSFSTCLFVSPIETSLKILRSIKGLEAMIILNNWVIHKSQWFSFEKI